MTRSLPVGWILARPTDLAADEQYSLGIGPFGSNLKVSDYTDGGVPLVFVRNIRAESFEGEGVKFVSERKADELRPHWVQPGDVLITKMGDPPGDSALYPESMPVGVITADCVKWRIDPAVGISRYFVYATRTTDVQQQIRDITKGVAQRKVSLARFKTVQYPVAPLPTQKLIVEALDSHLSRLHDVVTTLQRVQRNLKHYRASVLKAAVEGRLVPTEAELARKEGRDYEPASVVLAATEPPPRPARYKSRSRSAIPGHAALSVGPLNAPLPEGWVGTPLADVARLESGHTPSRKHPEWWGGDIRWIGIKDARAHHGGTIHETLQRTNEDGLANSAARLLPAQTVCLSRTASVGYVVVMGRPMATSQDFVNWICTPAIDPHWLRIVLLADRDALQRFGKGTTHTTIYFPEVLSLHVALPPLAEQRRIVAEVDRLLSVGDQTAAAASASLRRISRLRQSILNWAFEGKLVDQDPNDEPASVLLERIKAGREKIRAAAKAEKKPGLTKRRKKPA